MSLKKWLNNQKKQWWGFGYRSFMLKLMEDGKEDVITPDKSSGINLRSTIYLDADLQFNIELPEGKTIEDIDKRVAVIHLNALNDKIALIDRFINHSGALAVFIAFIAPWAVNYGPLLLKFEQNIGELYSLYSSIALSTAVIAFRKQVVPFVMKQVAGKIFSIRFRGIALKKI